MNNICFTWCYIHSITQILTKPASFFWMFSSDLEEKSAVGLRILLLYQLKYLINQHVQITDLQKHKKWLLMFLFILLMCNPLKLHLIIVVDFLVSFSNAQHSGYCFIFMQLYPCPRHQIRGRFPFLSLAGGIILFFFALLRNLSGASCLTQISGLHRSSSSSSSSTGLRQRRGTWEGDPTAMTTDVCISCGQTHNPHPLDRRVAVGWREVERGLWVIKRSKWCCHWVTVSLKLSLHSTPGAFLLMAHFGVNAASSKSKSLWLPSLCLFFTHDSYITFSLW